MARLRTCCSPWARRRARALDAALQLGRLPRSRVRGALARRAATRAPAPHCRAPVRRMTRTPIHSLVGDLHTNLKHGSRGKEIAGLLADYAARERDWRDFAHFNEVCYARNLVSGSELFEL